MKILFIGTLNQSLPHTSSTAQTMIKGVGPFHISAVVTFAVEEAGGAGMVPAESSRLRSAGDSQGVSGCQILRKPIRQAIDTSEAPISTIQGLMKLEIRNCGTAKETPVTRMAGQISFMPLKPAKVQINQNGTISEKNGSCPPTTPPSTHRALPVTDPRPR